MAKEKAETIKTAEDLAGEQREISVAEFFEKNRHLLGFDNPAKALLTVVREAVDNSLDACESARILPEIEVKIKQLSEDRFFVAVQDNGPGIMKEQIPRVFGKLLYGSKFGKGKQSRGQQGIGISSAVLYSQLTSGKPAIIYSRTSDKKPVHVFHLRIDTVKNEPQIVKEETVEDKIKEHGIRIEMELEGKYIQRQQSVEEYLKQTAIVNPFATITYSGPEGIKLKFTRVTEKLPVQPVGIKPHPHGVEIGVLDRMMKLTNTRNISGFLQNEFCRVGSGTAQEICRNANVDPDTKPKEMQHEQIQNLWKAIQATPLMKPPLDCLSPITAPLLESSLKKEFNLEFVASITRPATVYRGNPFQIECCIGYGGELKHDTSAKIMRFANRVPLMYQASACAMTKALSKVDWRHYKIDQQGGMPQGPIVVLVHICSAWVPYTSEGKEAIASYPDIIKEVKLAVQDCARKLGYYLSGRRRLLEQKERQNLFEKYIPEAAITLSYLSGTPKEKIIKGLEAMLKRVDVIATDSFADKAEKPEEAKKTEKNEKDESEEEEKEE
ncbi:MAG: DNA topoisomerase VI subunit B [Candidatus Aenigmatarchaeota archaeon]